MSLKLKFKKLSEYAKVPNYQTDGAAGFDFYSTESVTLRAGEVHLVSTGLSAEIPQGYEIQVRARSGLAAKKGVFLVNGIGTIDSDYRGEIKVILSTCLKEPVELKKGERIAQGVFAKVDQAVIVETKEISETTRGSGGFGSTGAA